MKKVESFSKRATTAIATVAEVLTEAATWEDRANNLEKLLLFVLKNNGRRAEALEGYISSDPKVDERKRAGFRKILQETGSIDKKIVQLAAEFGVTLPEVEK